MNTDNIFAELTKIESWPAVGLVFALCIVAGYCWKLAKFKCFPNDAIPAIVVLTGALAMLLVGADEPAGVSGRVWHTRQFIVGCVIGFTAWLSHALILSRVEDWISNLVPGVGKALNGKPPPPDKPSVPVPAFAVMCALGFVVGCATLAPGADPFVVRVEQSQTMADVTFDFVLHIDQADRGFWRTNAPAFHNFCSWLRTPVPYSTTNLPRVIALQVNVADLKGAYKTGRTAGNSNALYSAWAVLSAAVGQANSWSNIVVIPTPH